MTVKALGDRSDRGATGPRLVNAPVLRSPGGALLAGEAVESAGASDDGLTAAFAHAPTGMSVSALDGRWLQINDAYCRMLGYAPADLLGASFRDVTHPDDVSDGLDFLAAALAGELESLEREQRYLCRDGSVLWARVRAKIIRDEQGEPLFFVSHVQDITQRRETHDLLGDSERTLRSVIDNTPAIICVKGRDHRYKLVNREFEQVFGVTSEWIVGRSDSEILSASTIDDVHAKDLLVLDHGQTAQDEEVVIRDGNERWFLRTRFPLRDEHGGIYAVCVASTEITDRRAEERTKRERLQCSELIYAALAQDRLVLYGQPIVDLASMQPVRLELLIRMQAAGNSKELIAPSEFLPAAERFDLISVIDEWVIDRAIEFTAAGHRVTVNVSAQTISDQLQVDRIEQAIIAGHAEGQSLVFEITETAVADNLEAARSFAVRLRHLGCLIALDDFGIGHGTFTYLRHLPVDFLKIDMQFVRDLLSDDEDRQVVEAIVGVARQFKIDTIAEGVEDLPTLQALEQLGVNYVQGYLTGRPAPVPELWRPPRHRRQGDTHGNAAQ